MKLEAVIQTLENKLIKNQTDFETKLEDKLEEKLEDNLEKKLAPFRGMQATLNSILIHLNIPQPE